MNKKRIIFEIDEELNDKIRNYSQKIGLSFSAFCRTAITKEINKIKKMGAVSQN